MMASCIMRLPLLFLLVSLVFAGGPLTLEENKELQKICGTKFAPALSTGYRRFRSMNTPNAARKEGPWAVEIRQFLDEIMGIEFTIGRCTGSLISSRHVITSAHCLLLSKLFPCEPVIDFKRLRIMTTGNCNTINGVETCDSSLKQSSSRVKNVFLSKEYCEQVRHGDVAVLELEEDIPLDNKIWPVCLNVDAPKAGVNLTLFGYGNANDLTRTGRDVLRRLETNIVDRATCQEYSDWESVYLLSSNIICSRHSTGMACEGDRGAGEAIIEGGKASLVAVLSYGIKCDPTVPPEKIMDFSSGIKMHSRWIAAVTGVNPGHAVTQEERDLLKKKYIEYNVLPAKK